MVSCHELYLRRQGHSGLEDGTASFTAVAAAVHGFTLIQSLGGFRAVGRHAGCLARYLAESLAEMNHSAQSAEGLAEGGCGRGPPVAELYGWGPLGQRDGDQRLERLPSEPCRTLPEESHGPTVTFNLLRPDGSYVGFEEVGAVPN